jgi:hypothetical protein
VFGGGQSSSEGNECFEGEQEVGMNGTGADVAGADVAGADVAGADVAGADVAGANGGKSDFLKVTFIQHQNMACQIPQDSEGHFDSSPPGFKPLTDAAHWLNNMRSVTHEHNPIPATDDLET